MVDEADLIPLIMALLHLGAPLNHGCEPADKSTSVLKHLQMESSRCYDTLV